MNKRAVASECKEEDVLHRLQQQPNKKKQKQQHTNKIIKIRDFDVDTDVKFLSIQKRNGFNSIKVYNKHTDGPLLLSFNGGGYLNKNFGVSPSMFGNLTVTFDLNDDMEYKACTKLHTALCNLAINNRNEWFPLCTGSDAMLRDCANQTVTPPKPKKDADGLWNAKFKAMSDTDSGMLNASGKRVFNAKSMEGTQIENLLELNGRKWEKAVVEVTCIYTSSKNSFGLSKRMRAIKVLPAQNMEEIDCSETDEDDVAEDHVSDC